MTTSPKIVNELRAIANQSGGLLIPEKVVEAARDKKSPLHNSFCWDNTEAAHLYRIYQAKNLIRVVVEFHKVNGENRAVRVFVSLTPDRKESGGGYREMVAVLSNKDMHQQMLVDAIDELQTFEAKYASLKELSEVFRASRKLRNSLLQNAA